jgi:hypothetical protein
MIRLSRFPRRRQNGILAAKASREEKQISCRTMNADICKSGRLQKSPELKGKIPVFIFSGLGLALTDPRFICGKVFWAFSAAP